MRFIYYNNSFNEFIYILSLSFNKTNNDDVDDDDDDDIFKLKCMYIKQ